jgi:hypothetical protein
MGKERRAAGIDVSPLSHLIHHLRTVIVPGIIHVIEIAVAVNAPYLFMKGKRKKKEETENKA